MAGTAVVLVLAVALTLSLSPATRAAAPWLIYGLFAIIALTVVLFAALTVEVDATEIRVKFGIGFVGKTMAVADVVRCEAPAHPDLVGMGPPLDAVRVAIQCRGTRCRPGHTGARAAGHHRQRRGERLKAAIDARIAARQR